MTTEETATQRLASYLLNKPAGEWIAEQRANGDTWRKIADDFTDITGVRVSHETIRKWGEAWNTAA